MNNSVSQFKIICMLIGAEYGEENILTIIFQGDPGERMYQQGKNTR